MNALKEHLNDRLSIYVLVIILSGLMFYYNLVYVPTNERKLNEHALRIIENKARILKDKYTAYQTAMSSAQMSYFVHWYFTLNPDVKKVYLLRNNGAYYYSDSSQLLSDFKGATIKTFTNDDDFRYARVDRNLIPQVNGPQQQGLDKDIWKVRRGDFYFVYSPEPDFIQVRTKKKVHSRDTVFQYFWLNIKRFTANIKSNDFYEDIFLLRDTNDKSNYDQKKLEVSAFDSQVLDESKLGLVRLSLPDNAGKIGVGVYDQKIFDQNYKAYYKLVKLKKGLNVYVLGLVTTSNFQKYARQIPTWFLVFCSLGILILILLFPVLKLFFLNEHERLSALDARLSVFSVVMCASLILMVLAGNYIFWVSEQQKNDASLMSLSNTVRYRFSKEIDTLRDAVSKDNLFSSTSEEGNTARFKKKHKEIDFNEVLSINNDGNINTIFFSDTSKCNNVKMLPVKLSDRDYYKIMKTAERNGNELDYQIEAINSLTTGKGEAAICIPLKTITYNATVAPGDNENGSAMRVITSTLHSIINTRIPSPYKFAIVDRTGEVKFNSESKEVIFENFINECNNNRALAAYFENEIKGYVDFNYLRAECRGYIQPLRKGWSLIVYFEMGNSRGFAAQVFSLCLITLVMVALYVLFVQLLLASDNKKPMLLQTRAFFYDWLNPNNNTPEMWLSLAWVNASLFVLEMVWLYFSVSTILTIIFLFIVITTSYYIVYTKLSGFRKNYNRIKSYRMLRWLLVAWIIIFIMLQAYYYEPRHILILLPIGIILILAVHQNHSGYVIWLRKFLASAALKKYNSYRAFLFSWLLILAIGPSILFVTDHFAFQNFIRSYAYLLEDVKKLQIKSVSEQEGKAGSDYTLRDLGQQKKYVPLFKDNPDFTFYSLIPRYSMHDASVTGVQFNYIPEYTRASISVSPRFVKIEVPLSNLTDNAKTVARVRSLHTQMPLFEERSIMLGLTTLLALLAFIWTMKEIPGKIFFMPVSDFPYPDHYPPRDFSKNEIEREFENDDLDKHPLKGLTEKNDIINTYNNILKYDDDYKKQMDTEVLLLSLQQAAKENYQAKWESLSDAEKFLLYDLADDGVTNQTETSLFNTLSQKGLLRLYPKLEVVNTSFANYVKTVMPKEKISEWQKNENKNGRWNNLRIALIIIIIAAFGFLSVAEEDFLGRVSALLASVAVAVPNLISAVGKISNLFIKE